MTANIDSRIMSFGDLLTGQINYAVPIYQRDYSWTREEVEELWTDIINTIDENRSEHFMGSIVVDNSQPPALALIDGQQRLATISLLMCAVRDIASQHSDDQMAQQISRTYIGDLNLRDHKTLSKLRLNERNNQFYQDYFVEGSPIGSLTELARRRTVHRSNKLMTEAYLFLHRQLQARIDKIGDWEEALLQLEEIIRTKLVAILITVNDTANAYLIFETLNDRGLDLSIADLLKNHLFSRAGGRLEEMKSRWDEMNALLGRTDLTRFVRHYWLSSRGRVRDRDLYRAITTSIRDTGSAIGFVRQLTDAAESYGALEIPESPIWDSYDPSVRDGLRQLGIFRVSQCYPLLLAAKQTLDARTFAGVVRFVVVLTFRYNVISGLNPGNVEVAYSEASKSIRDAKSTSVKSIFQFFETVYPDDVEFKRHFIEKVIDRPPLARYILAQINDHVQGGSGLVTDRDPARMTLEHILPRSPSQAWRAEFPGESASQYVDRLGNLTLLESSANREIANAAFAEKCEQIYAKSQLRLNAELCEYQQWTPTEIDQRQERMAQAAVQIWRVDF